MQCLAAWIPSAYPRSSTGRKPRNGRRWREVKKTRKKVRWKRMYVEHVAAGIASMCHRGNHAGNAEAHLTALPSCIYLPPSYSVYIYCLRASTNRVSSIAVSLSLPITPRISLFLSARTFTERKNRDLRVMKSILRVINFIAIYFEILSSISS